MREEHKGSAAEVLRRVTPQVLVRGGREGQGSGVVWDGAGRIVSNAHVVRRPEVEVVFWDGERRQASAVARDEQRDLALLEVEGGRREAAEWGDSGELKPGDPVVAVGNPLGFIGALSEGVVQQVGPVEAFGGREWICAAILLAPGNSGGALARRDGRVVGINTMVSGRWGFAVPSRTVARFVRQAESGRPPLRLGVSLTPVVIGPQRKAGWRIQDIVSGSRAERASLRPGDVIIGIDGSGPGKIEELEERLESGGLLRLQFVRGNQERERTVVIELDLTKERRLANAA